MFAGDGKRLGGVYSCLPGPLKVLDTCDLFFEKVWPCEEGRSQGHFREERDMIAR